MTRRPTTRDRHVAIAREMNELGLGSHPPVAVMLLALLTAMSTVSALATLISLD